jgi:glycosyltransferase involved in cell wall biosynthesis
MPSSTPKVSVYLITFNQAQFIAKALESVLMQKTAFDYEIVVGDDCSTDGTIEILKSYQQRHAQKIKLVLHGENVGMMRNALDVLANCTGEYIACLEGDDYWTDPEKLQRQADYLDHHTGCALCHHKVDYISWPDARKLREFPPLRYRDRSDGRDLAMFNYIQTCSVMFRRTWLPVLGAQFRDLKLGDWPIFVLLSQRGWIGFIHQTMAHYRVHSNNSWNNRPPDYKIRAMEKMAWYLLERVENHSKEVWRDMILALALKDAALAVKSLSPIRAFERLRYFVQQSVRFHTPFWLFKRLWPYYRANYLDS